MRTLFAVLRGSIRRAAAQKSFQDVQKQTLFEVSGRQRLPVQSAYACVFTAVLRLPSFAQKRKVIG